MNPYIIEGLSSLTTERDVVEYARVNGISGKDVADLISIWLEKQIPPVVEPEKPVK